MLPNQAINEATWSPKLAIAMEEICDRFEKALRSGAEPAVKDFLTAVPEPARPALEAELLALQQAYQDLRAKPAPAEATHVSEIAGSDTDMVAGGGMKVVPGHTAQ